MEKDPGQTTNIIGQNPEIAKEMKAAYDAFWKEARPLMVNEDVPMSPTRPFHVWFEEQQAAGGIPKWEAPAL
jgi:arylsulfatase